MVRFLTCASLAVLGTQAGAQWHRMPNGKFYHEDCIHSFDASFHVEEVAGAGSRVNFGDDAQDLLLPPCPHAARESLEAVAEAPKADGARHDGSLESGYYSDWAAYAQTVRPAGFTSMSSVWDVPAEPTSKGPAPPLVESSIYFFNGLENGHGVAGEADVILQPVLQYGKSGCLLDPLKWGAWYLTAYQVGVNGRAYCGRSIGPLKQGEQVLGEMVQSDSETNTWRVDATRLSTGEVSTHSVALGDRVMDAAYATLEAMVIYNCQAYPASSSVTFANNSLTDDRGEAVAAQWQKMPGHSECSQDVQLPSSSSDPLKLVWDSTIGTEVML